MVFTANKKDEKPDEKKAGVEERRTPRALLAARKLAAEGLICIASFAPACGGRPNANDAGMDADREADALPDADGRMDADHDGRPDALPEADIEEEPCILAGERCQTGNAENVEVNLPIGGSMAVAGVRISALRNEGPDHIFDLLCDDGGEVFVDEGRLAMDRAETFEVDAAQVTLRWVGTVGNLSMFMRATVSTPCME